MVVFVDLDDAFEHHTFSPEKPFPKLMAPAATADSVEFLPSPTSSDDERDATTREEPENPNRNAFSAALSCYPYGPTPQSPLNTRLTRFCSSIVKEIARAVDLNTLHALSRTCRQFHVNLAPFRHQLVRETLRCENEYIETVVEMLDGRAVINGSVKSVLRLLSQGNSEPGRMTRGKVGKCARDMVGECRRCNKVVCRVRQLIHSRRRDQTKLTVNRTARSNRPPERRSRAVSVASAKHAALPRSPTISPIHTRNQVLRTSSMTDRNPPPSRPSPAVRATATTSYGSARRAVKPYAATTQPTGAYGRGEHDTAHISAAG